MSIVEFGLYFILVIATFTTFVIISDRIKLRNAKRFVSAILSNDFRFVELVQSGDLIAPGLAEMMIRDAAQKLDKPLQSRLRQALNSPESDELIFEIAVVSKVLTDKRDHLAPKITIGENAVMLHDLFMIHGAELKQAA